MRDGESDGRGREEYTNRLHWGLGNKRLSREWKTKKKNKMEGCYNEGLREKDMSGSFNNHHYNTPLSQSLRQSVHKRVTSTQQMGSYSLVSDNFLCLGFCLHSIKHLAVVLY